MKIIEYLCCTLICMCLLKMANTEISRDKIRAALMQMQGQDSFLQFERQLLDALTTEKTIKPKRPFCNAFTGCGRFVSEEKREKKKEAHIPTLRDLQDFHMTSDGMRLPVSFYKTLLNAAKQNTWNAIDRDEYDYRLQQMPQIYLSDQMPLRDTLES